MIKTLCLAQTIVSVKCALKHTALLLFSGDTSQDDTTSGPDSRGEKGSSSI